MADAYVDSAAPDDTGAGTEGDPKKLIGSAYTLVGDGDTVYFADGTYDLADESTNYLFLSLDKSVTFRSSSGNPDLVNIKSETGTADGFHTRLFLNDIEARIEFRDLTFTGSANMNPFGGITYMDGSTTANHNDVVIDNCRYILNGSPGFGFYLADSDTKFLGNVIIKDSTIPAIKSAIHLRKGVDSIRITGCTLQGVAASAGQTIMFIGMDSVLNANPVGPCYFANNTIEYTNGSADHAVLLGSGVAESQFVSNNISAPDVGTDIGNIGIVVKSDGHTINNNIIEAIRCVLFNGSKNNRLENNTLNAIGSQSYSNCVQFSNAWYTDGGTQTRECTGNFSVNNIIDATNGKYCYWMMTDDNGLVGGIETTDEGLFTDYNNYTYATGVLYDEVNTREITTLEDLKTVWQTETTPWTDIYNKDNDENSSSVDPAPKNTGRPDANGGDTSIGAIGATATAGGYRSRYSG